MMELIYRKAVPEDTAACVDLRGKTRQNAVSVEELKTYGITLESWRDDISAGSTQGYICLSNDQMVGYCFGIMATGEIAVVALLPEFEGKGIGKTLLNMMIQDFKRLGFDRLFLGSSSDPQTRAYGFYRHLGWKPNGALDRFGDQLLEYFFTQNK